MLNFMDRDITYTHRRSDFTQDVYVAGNWIASATCYHSGDEVADEVQYRQLLDAPIEDAPVQLASWSTATASAGDPPPDDAPGGPLIPGDTGYGKHAALALQTLLATQQQGLCLNCGGKHRTWACPEIAARLFAPEPWKDVALGRELCRMRWHNFNGFVTLLRSVRDHGHLLTYAASYQAFVRDHSPDSTMTIDQVVQAWGRLIGDDGTRQQAA